MHTHTLMHSHITDGDGRTGGKDMKCLSQELQVQENRRVLMEDFKDWNSRNNLQALCTVPCCFTWGVSLSLIHPVLVYVGSTSCAPQCWFIWGVSLTCPVLVYVWSFSYTPYAGFFLLGVSLIRSVLASLCREFLLYKTKKKCKSNKNVHNWVMLLFKAEADIHKAPQGCIMSSSRQYWNK